MSLHTVKTVACDKYLTMSVLFTLTIL